MFCSRWIHFGSVSQEIDFPHPVLIWISYFFLLFHHFVIIFYLFFDLFKLLNLFAIFRCVIVVCFSLLNWYLSSFFLSFFWCSVLTLNLISLLQALSAIFVFCSTYFFIFSSFICFAFHSHFTHKLIDQFIIIILLFFYSRFSVFRMFLNNNVH